MWSAARRLFPFCCGGAILLLILGVLGISLGGRLPSTII
jgi:hypothetical protein